MDWGKVIAHLREEAEALRMRANSAFSLADPAAVEMQHRASIAIMLADALEAGVSG